MSIIYNPDNWFVSANRAIKDYISDKLNDPDVEVEMSFPDTRELEKTMPLDKVLVHLEVDDMDDPVLGFGVPGVLVIDDTDPDNPTSKLHEAAAHVMNFDVGVWVSAEMGGVTKRMQVVQALKNMFATATGRIAFNTTTEGLNIVSFDGGRNVLDRINGVPVWRTLDMTLIVRCMSRHIPATSEKVPLSALQNPDLTIANEGGGTSPVETP